MSPTRVARSRLPLIRRQRVLLLIVPAVGDPGGVLDRTGAGLATAASRGGAAAGRSGAARGCGSRAHHPLGRCGHAGARRAGSPGGRAVLSRHHRSRHGRGLVGTGIPGRRPRARGHGDLHAPGASARPRDAAVAVPTGAGCPESARRRSPPGRRGVRGASGQRARRTRLERLGARRTLGARVAQHGQPVAPGVLAHGAPGAARLSVQSDLRARTGPRPAGRRSLALGCVASPAQRHGAGRRRRTRAPVVPQSVSCHPQPRPARLPALGRSRARCRGGDRRADSRPVLHGRGGDRSGRRVLLSGGPGGRDVADGRHGAACAGSAAPRRRPPAEGGAHRALPERRTDRLRRGQAGDSGPRAGHLPHRGRGPATAASFRCTRTPACPRRCRRIPRWRTSTTR